MRKEDGTTPEEEPECTPSFKIVTCRETSKPRDGGEMCQRPDLEVAARQPPQRRRDPHGVVVAAAAANAREEWPPSLPLRALGGRTCRDTR
jgi:hypothetical protein